MQFLHKLRSVKDSCNADDLGFRIACQRGLPGFVIVAGDHDLIEGATGYIESDFNFHGFTRESDNQSRQTG